MDTVLGWLWRAGSRRALGGEGWAWAVLAGSAWLWRRARRPAEEAVAVIKLRPGQHFIVDVVAPGGRRAERQGAR